ncbi:MAG: ribosomal protein [Candidatus Saccharibacteria bacterium]|nr:ribosomal protein [Candidatus Saccharibacteria bacterium]
MSTTSTDPIADMLSRIRNAIAVNKSEIVLPHSKVKESVAKLLAESQFISGVHVTDATIGKSLVLTLNDERQNSPITEIKRLSKPGRRYFVGADQIPVIKRGRGVVIVSTSKGMMIGAQAKQQGVGGELICSVY